jgi:hypothetical protein
MTMKRLLAVAVTAALVSGCGQSTPKPDTPPQTTKSSNGALADWPEKLKDFRFHWTAEPGIDLNTGPGILVRAYLESFDVASYTFDLDNSYPGFLRATPPNMSRIANGALYQLVAIRPLGVDYTVTPEDARPHYGFVPFHVLDLVPLGDGYQATVCTAEYGSFIESTARPGKFVSIGTDDKTGQPYASGFGGGVFVKRVQFTQNDPRVGSTPPQPPNAPQTGPAPAPSDDVFGDWFVTASSVKFWGRVDNPDKPDFPTPELQQRCADSMPQNEAERTAMMTGYKDAPPPHGDAIPGWPAEAK